MSNKINPDINSIQQQSNMIDCVCMCVRARAFVCVCLCEHCTIPIIIMADSKHVKWIVEFLHTFRVWVCVSQKNFDSSETSSLLFNIAILLFCSFLIVIVEQRRTIKQRRIKHFHCHFIQSHRLSTQLTLYLKLLYTSCRKNKRLTFPHWTTLKVKHTRTLQIKNVS